MVENGRGVKLKMVWFYKIGAFYLKEINKSIIIWFF